MKTPAGESTVQVVFDASIMPGTIEMAIRGHYGSQHRRA